MRALSLAFLLTLATQAEAECGNMCVEEWWQSATLNDFKKELNTVADLSAANAEGLTALHNASMYGTVDMVRLLLEAGADISAQNECGSTPLHSAASRGSVENIIILLKDGADVNAKEADGWTALHRAASCFKCPPEIIKILLSAGASVNAIDEDGMSPWDYAQENMNLIGTDGFIALKEAHFEKKQ